jgi:hypothetical protein
MRPSYLRCTNGKTVAIAQATADTAEKIAAIAATLTDHSIYFAFVSGTSAAISAALAPAIAAFIPILASGAKGSSALPGFAGQF